MDRSNLASSRIVNLIRDNLEGPDSVFVLRDRQFQLRERKAFLVSRTRAEAERLGERVDEYVHNARSHVEQRGESVTRAARSGALGITILTFVCIAVALLGIRVVIRMVGSQITKLNPMRAYCVALSAAVTVIVASWLGLPVSSTHIAVGAVFGVGFFREWDAERRLRNGRQEMPERPVLAPEERGRRKLVRRAHFMTIIAAWVITVPAAALMSALFFYGIRAVAG